MISIIVPIYNEEKNIPLLIPSIHNALQECDADYEIVLVDDGSIDNSLQELYNFESDSRVKVVSFRRNYGQTAAMMAGIDYSIGDIIVPLDADLQNDPKDIPRLIEKINQGYDVVSGWRKQRKDNKIKRNFPSRIANFIISKISGVKLHDYGCSLKAYRRDVICDVKLYGEMHRFVPIYASLAGAKVTEIEVMHHKRIHGVSKYGLERIVKVILDLLVVKFLSGYSTKPIYIFGGFGLLNVSLSFFAAVLALILKLYFNVSFILTPLPLLIITLFTLGIISILMGFLAEINIRTYHESQDKNIYSVKSTFNT